MGPRFSPGQELGELRLEHAEFVTPRITQDPEFKSASYLVIPPGGTERFQTADFGFDIVGLQIQVHSFLGDLLVTGLLQEDPYLRVRETEPTVDGAALLRQEFFGGIECRRPERDGSV